MRKWIGLAIGLAIALALGWTAAALIRGAGGMLGFAPGVVDSAPDPMFSEAPERVTRPPALSEEPTAAPDRDEDPSAHWVYRTLTPIAP